MASMQDYPGAVDEQGGAASPMSRRASTQRIEATLMRCLERLHAGIVILDENNHVEYSNAAARRALQGRTSIEIRRRRLRTTDERLAQLLAQDRRHPVSTNGWTLELRDPQLPQAIQAILVSGQTGRRANDPLVLHVVVPREARSVAALREVYRLTTAEAGLVSHLTGGNDLNEAAEALGVSVHTARTHLKRIFHKCGVRSQAELLRLAVLLPEPLF